MWITRQVFIRLILIWIFLCWLRIIISKSSDGLRTYGSRNGGRQVRSVIDVRTSVGQISDSRQGGVAPRQSGRARPRVGKASASRGASRLVGTFRQRPHLRQIHGGAGRWRTDCLRGTLRRDGVTADPITRFVSRCAGEQVRSLTGTVSSRD